MRAVSPSFIRMWKRRQTDLVLMSLVADVQYRICCLWRGKRPSATPSTSHHCWKGASSAQVNAGGVCLCVRLTQRLSDRCWAGHRETSIRDLWSHFASLSGSDHADPTRASTDDDEKASSGNREVQWDALWKLAAKCCPLDLGVALLSKRTQFGVDDYPPLDAGATARSEQLRGVILQHGLRSGVYAQSLLAGHASLIAQYVCELSDSTRQLT